MNWGVPSSCGQAQRLRRATCAALALAGMTLAAAPAQAQAVSARGTAQAVIVEPLGLVKIQDLRFGRMAAGTTAGTVTVDPTTGARDLQVPKALMTAFGHVDCGIYCRIIAGGRLLEGERLEVVEPSTALGIA